MMKLLRLSSPIFVFCLSALFAPLPGSNADDFVFHHENVLGTSLELRLRADSDTTAQKAEAAVLTEIDRLTEIYSQYSPSSEFSRFCKAPRLENMSLSPELHRTLRRCEEWYRISQGAFNPAAETLAQVWSEAERQGKLPTTRVLAAAAQSIQTQHWNLDSDSGNAERLSGSPLSLNAIAKGTILDAVCDHVLTQFDQVAGVVINVGGDVRVAGDISELIAIADPKADAIGSKPLVTFALDNAGIATSGASERHFNIAGKSYSHIIDPRSGQPVAGTMSATVIAKDAETADAVATICSVLPVAASITFVNSLPSVECLLITAAGTIVTSFNWPGETPADGDDSPANDTATADQPEASIYEMLVEIDITKSENSSRYRRPYVAVWVEDQDGFPVKTLSLFLMTNDPGPRWHRDLRRWYAGDQMRRLVEDKPLIGTISKPTRNPGNYKFAWDGRDDSGEMLKPGKYTLYIEAAREHGTYQMIKYPFKFGDESFDAKLAGNVEIKSASVRYTKK